MKRLKRVRNRLIAAAVVVWLWHIVTQVQVQGWPWWVDPGYGLIVILACEAAYRHGKLRAHRDVADLIVSGKLPEVSYVEQQDVDR